MNFSLNKCTANTFSQCSLVFSLTWDLNHSFMLKFGSWSFKTFISPVEALSTSTYFHWAQACRGTWCRLHGRGWSPWHGNPGLPWQCGDTAEGWRTPPSPGHPVHGNRQKVWVISYTEWFMHVRETDSPSQHYPSEADQHIIKSNLKKKNQT